MIFNTITNNNNNCFVLGGFSLFPPSISYAPSFLFRKSILYDVSPNVGFEEWTGYTIEALGDFTNQKTTDLITVSSDRKAIQILVWNTYKWKFVNHTQFDYRLSNLIDENVEIVSLVASDFNYDGALDLLVTLMDPSSSEQLYTHHFLLGDFKSLRDGGFLSSKTTDQISVVDVNGDLLPDLFSTDASTGKRTFWINDNVEYKSNVLNYTQIDQESFTETENLNPLAFPMAVINVDIDGDCGSDLIIMSCSHASSNTTCDSPHLEIWINEMGKLKLNTTINLPKGAGRPVILDFDHDGDMDILYPVCYPLDTCEETNELHVIFNDQLPLCTGITIDDTNCRQDTDLCRQSSFSLSKRAVIELPDSRKRILHHLDSTKFHSRPATLRVGDFNLDGYPDLVVSVVNTKDDHQEVGIELWQNVECPEASSSENQLFNCTHTSTSRTFQVVSQHVDALNEASIAKVPPKTKMNEMPKLDAFFLDIDETGVLDIITIYHDEHLYNRTLGAFFNCFFNDAYFLKTISTNGVTSKDGTYYYGVNAPGVTIKFTSTKLDGTKQANMQSLISQTNYLALETPYKLFGLGRTNGYVEEFFVGKAHATKDSSTNYKSFSAIIPNSQLVTLNTPPNKPDSWDVQLFVNPSGASLWVIIAEIVSLILLAIPILILWFREHREDKREKEEVSREISSVFI
ncbi:predicted protein [Naegleria gruberi]|uniref:Predicted protein n=1 Tax=Naegleria gruberi TaxID=5762 RepID=D2VKS6_NAEGR|nr:uncharacterized protein NAEGRDRAFT_69497 [Naegleria gruberi]EFC42645.1 predicted protein [Naegleria gruberi]|eukprot:XP_002675389.1 predicted protein [Naegleria gruberi strain NEG-M]